MRFSIAAVAACAVSAHAFKDTSPFVLFSSSPLPSTHQTQRTQQLQSSLSVLNSAKEILAQCSDDIYIFVVQRGIRSSELSSNTPHLKKALAAPSVHGRYAVSEVVGLQSEELFGLARYVRDECKATSVPSIKEGLVQKKAGSPVYVQIESFSFTPGLESGRREQLADSDAHLFSTVFNVLPEGTKYTVVFGTTPSTAAAHDDLVYEADFQEPVHMDLKRNVLRRESKSDDGVDRRPLFEKYQYFTPGLFMGLLVTVLLLSILGVGLSAISSLEVSYGAFDKEMGPAAQKKAQ